MGSKETRYFSEEELKNYTGQNGSPTYIVFKGKVYDISSSQLWANGTHMDIHSSRENLEETIQAAPHDEDVLSRFPIIGEVGNAPSAAPAQAEVPTTPQAPTPPPPVPPMPEEKSGSTFESKILENTVENQDKCICKGCPSYPHLCNGELLYCSPDVGKSHCDIRAMGCVCNKCPVYSEFGLSGLYFCDKDTVGGEGVLMRKKGALEEEWFYRNVAEIKKMAYTGKSAVVSMGSKKRPFLFDDLHFVPGQVYRIPRLLEEPVNTEVIIGPKAKKPFRVTTPIMISGMSFGAISKNVILIISKVAANLKMAFNSGEGGIVPEELENGKGYVIIQYSTGRFGITDEVLKTGAAVEIRFGQGAYPGKGSYLPAEKITPEIAEIRGLKPGEAAYSPAHHTDMRTPEEIQKKVDWLRDLTRGVPIGAKIGCGNVEKDVSILVECGVDYIALDGFGGGTGATYSYARENMGIPVVAAIPRARKVLEQLDAEKDVTLIAGGGLRTSADFAKCLALGANAVYTATAALIAINCEQYRICHTGLCPTGVTTQNPDLTKLLEVDEGVRRLTNFIELSTHEIANLTRMVGKNDIGELEISDLVSMNKDLSALTGVKWADGKG